jgi:DNA mismatch repair protein MutS2
VSDIIERLLEVEKEARQIIARAEKEAAEAVEKARDEARQIVAESRRLAREEADKLLESQATELDKQRDERLRREESQLPSPDSIDRRKLADAVEFVVRAVAYGDSGTRAD